ncbi:MAG: hypothetical protein SV062_11490 [Thermodesulfobacteriota bacterium]|nr:hypothetical protein [Thermodesulfobacteriota bacterium]
MELKNFKLLEEKIYLITKNYRKLLTEKARLELDLKEKEEQSKILDHKIKEINDIHDLLKKKLKDIIKKIEKFTG